MTKQELALLSAQKLGIKPVYNMNEDFIPSIHKSRRTAYRYRKYLESLGILRAMRGNFILNTTVVSQSTLFPKLLPSLNALKDGRKFGRRYNQADIEFVEKHIDHHLITLDYKIWELTKYQYPSDLYVYVKDIDKSTNYLKENKFKEGRKGHIIILPMLGEFTNEIQRVYLDCIAKGGRSTRDAIAIELLYGDKLEFRGQFNIEDIKNVQENLRMTKKQ
jgi:hypothetical protein